MDKLTQLQKNLDEFWDRVNGERIELAHSLEQLRGDYHDKIYKPFTELLKELGLNELSTTEGNNGKSA